MPLIYAYRDSKWENGIGGSLKAIIDGNIDDGNVEFCRNWAEKHGDMAGVRLAEILAQMSKTQRKKIAGLFFK